MMASDHRGYTTVMVERDETADAREELGRVQVRGNTPFRKL